MKEYYAGIDLSPRLRVASRKKGTQSSCCTVIGGAIRCILLLGGLQLYTQRHPTALTRSVSPPSTE